LLAKFDEFGEKVALDNGGRKVERLWDSANQACQMCREITQNSKIWSHKWPTFKN